MAATNHERVGGALALLSQGLAPFVERECVAKYGQGWVEALPRNEVGVKVSKNDAQFLLKAMWDAWNEVFRAKLSQSDRTYVSELRDMRNRWAHQETFSTDDAYRALDTAHRLLLDVSAAEQAVEVDRMKQELLRTRFSEQTRQRERKAAVAPIEGQPAGGLKPWREIVTPHKDVASGRYQQAEFAADLHQVWRDEALPEYGDPVEFFRRTFITDGLKELILNAVRRWELKGGDPVVELQTNFGGGKTHSMIALYHLAWGYSPSKLLGVEAILAEAKLPAPTKVNVAVLVGHMVDPGSIQTKPNGTKVRTLWGELAWQLGGAEAFAVVAESDAKGTNPGAALKDLLRRYAPCLILIDEWVAYARQLYGISGLPAGSFDAQFTFAQALAEAARAVPGALLVMSVPASDIEVGGEGGRAALERLANVLGRVQSSWRPASAEEGFEIVRRRLFDELPAELAPDRDAVVKAFGNLYRTQKGEFPGSCGEGDYERRMTAAYPIHPELFDRLYGEWSTLDKFQRTRGVLRLMAAVIHELWERNDQSLLILPANVPIYAPAVASELTRYLEDGWAPVIETDVDGPNALPLRIDRDNPNLGRYSATRRVARTVYLGSAPMQQAANRGIDDHSIKLGSVQPGEAPPVFGDALRKLADQATYLYVDGQRYWYSLQPSVTRLARDRAASHFTADQVDHLISERLKALRDVGDFAAVHAAVRSAADVPDDPRARLVILAPQYAHDPKLGNSDARTQADAILKQRAAGPRLHRNMLVFLAADKTRLGDLEQAVRQYLAWKSIADEKDAMSLDKFQERQVETQVTHFNEAVGQRIDETYQWVLVPSQDKSEPEVRWTETRVMGSEKLATRVSRKLVADEALIPKYSGVRLSMDLNDTPLWRGDQVELKELWGDYSQYLYLPRLRDSGVLARAIEEGVAATTWDPDTFAYAGRVDADGRYVGLVAGKIPDVHMDSTAVLVKPEAARRQIAPALQQTGDGSDGGMGEKGEERGLPSTTTTTPLPVRFFGRVSLEPVRLLRDVGDIAEAIVRQLGKAGKTEVRITLEVDAASESGFPEDVQRTVTENARTLKFDSHEFEDH
jgi:predicted AAA+ superfamily ATPase